jgi:uncharacterized phage infection (PIP) family protein YhgE
MESDVNKQDEELQRAIAEQEQAMVTLLLRVMERPLAPLHQSLHNLKEQLAAVQQANAKAAQGVEAALSDALSDLDKSLKRRFSEVAEESENLKAGLGSLVSTLDRQNLGQMERDERIAGSLARTSGMLLQLDEKAVAAGAALATAERGRADVSNALREIRQKHEEAGHRLSHELDGMALLMEQRHAHVDGGIVRTTTVLDQLETKVSTAGDSLAAALRGITKVDAELGALREQEQASVGQLNSDLHGLTRQVDCQQALVTATVQEQLALQLHPLQLRMKWLFSVCALSCVSTLTLLAAKLF